MDKSIYTCNCARCQAHRRPFAHRDITDPKVREEMAEYERNGGVLFPE